MDYAVFGTMVFAGLKVLGWWLLALITVHIVVKLAADAWHTSRVDFYTKKLSVEQALKSVIENQSKDKTTPSQAVARPLPGAH